MRPLARKALEMIQAQGGRVHDMDVIERTLQEIGKQYRPGLIRWIRHDSGRWPEFLELEGSINAAALANDKKELAGALSAYRSFFSEVMEGYEKEKALPLFR
jgi:hypothetical protein